MRIDVIHLRGLQQRGDGRPGPAAAMAAREERFFLVMVCGRIARSTMLESISMRPSRIRPVKVALPIETCF